MAPDFLVVGRVVADETPTGLRPGGGAYYAALAADRLGRQVALVTNPHTALGVLAALPGIAVRLVGPQASTVFRNDQTPEGRVQHWYGSGAPIRTSDIPPEWRAVSVAHLATVAQDVEPAVAGLFAKALLGVTPQGWLRRRDRQGVVYAGPWRGALKVLASASVVVTSPEDYGAQRRGAVRLLARARVLVVTLGAAGARVRAGGRWRHISAIPAQAVDTTGAGDVFAAAFLVRYSETGDAMDAARFATCAAGLSVEGRGAAAVPTRAQVLARLLEAEATTAF
ncbi:MAG: ribokinase [Chloroflexi bacterium]|nr:ribokinase [Chloroflexota bacterium]